MEYRNRMNALGEGPSEQQISEMVEAAQRRAPHNMTPQVYGRCLAALDLTSLGVADSTATVTEFATKAMEMGSRFPGIPTPASLCVYPNFVDTVGLALGDTPMRITSVAGGFPSSQTYLEVKMLEAAMAVENGADEIDIVMSIGQLLSGEYDMAANEIETIRQEVGEDITLKVIIEAGVLPSPEDVRRASLLGILAGADFIKTSTGKTPVSATPQSVAQMCCAIRDCHTHTGRKAGIKVAGGVRTTAEAVLYYTLIEEILGEQWLTPALFRIGASSLANNLLTIITGRQITYF